MSIGGPSQGAIGTSETDPILIRPYVHIWDGQI